MFRVRHPDGRLIDMVNLSRAKDAGIAIALRLLNKQEHQERAPEAPPVR